MEFATKFNETLKGCDGSRACLLKDSQIEQTYPALKFSKSQIIIETGDQPENHARVKIQLACNRHWAPPRHIISQDKTKLLEWKSPISCPPSDYLERPCYVHTRNGDLIDLSPLIRNQQNNHNVSTGSFSQLKNFNLAVCSRSSFCKKEASYCYEDAVGQRVDGDNDLGNLIFDDKTSNVRLILSGPKEDSCPKNKRNVEVVFKCKDSLHSPRYPSIVKHDKCGTSIEWYTTYACPTHEISSPSSCSITAKSYNVTFNFTEITGKESIEIPNLNLNGRNKTIALNICGAFDKNILNCRSKSTNQVSACIFDSDSKKEKLDKKNSEILGDINNSGMKFEDGMFYWESSSPDRECKPKDLSTSIGARLDFLCSEKETEPIFQGIQNCFHQFKWSSPKFCLPKLPVPASTMEPQDPIAPGAAKTNSTTPALIPTSKPNGHQDNPISLITTPEPISNKHKESDTAKNDATVSTSTLQSKIKPEPQKMNSSHKFFMVGLIALLLVGFVVGILVLDQRTQLSIPLGVPRRFSRRRLSRSNAYNRLDHPNI